MDSKAVQTNVGECSWKLWNPLSMRSHKRIDNYLLYIGADAVIRETMFGLGFQGRSVIIPTK